MRTAWKLLAGVGIALVLVIVSAVVAVATLDVNTLIAPVQARVKALTGHNLEIKGGASFALSLRPRLVLRDVVLTHASPDRAPPLLSAERLELQLALHPFSSPHFELAELAVFSPVVELQSDDGSTKKAQPQSAGPMATSVIDGSSVAFDIKKFTITDGKLTYRRGQPGTETRVAIDRLFLHAADAASPVAIEFRGKVDDLPLSMQGTLGPLRDLIVRTAPYPVHLQGDVGGRQAAITTRVSTDAKRYTFDDLDIDFAGTALKGKVVVTDDGPRPLTRFDLTGGTLALAQLGGALTAPVPAQAGTRPAASERLFSETPIDLSPLRAIDAEGTLKLAELKLADGRRYTDVQVAMKLHAGRLDVSSARANTLGGAVSASGKIDVVSSATPALALNLVAKGLDLGALLALIDKPRNIRGGKTDVQINVAMRGASPHAWASSATGTVQVVVGKATLANTKIDAASVLDTIMVSVNPFREHDPSTELDCAVARLPFTNGVAKVDRSIAMETSRLGVSASGTLDLRNESLDFSFRLKARKGIPLEIPKLADLVRVSGPFASPHVNIDAAGSAKAIATIGAAVSTGGLSAVAQSLLSLTERQGPGPCQFALR